MNKPTNEMALEKCDCSLLCKCTLSHEGGGCDGKECPCWCHKVIPCEVDDSIKQALKKAKEGDEEEMKE